MPRSGTQRSTRLEKDSLMREVLCSLSASYLLTHGFKQVCFRPYAGGGLAQRTKLLRPGAPRVGDVGLRPRTWNMLSSRVSADEVVSHANVEQPLLTSSWFAALRSSLPCRHRLQIPPRRPVWLRTRLRPHTTRPLRANELNVCRRKMASIAS